MKASDLDEKFDTGEDISDQIDWSKARPPKLNAPIPASPSPGPDGQGGTSAR
jgi:hypothetical protein